MYNIHQGVSQQKGISGQISRKCNYIFDTLDLDIIRNNSIFNNLRLKNIAAEFLNDKGKLELDRVLIRNPYLLAHANSCDDIKQSYTLESTNLMLDKTGKLDDTSVNSNHKARI